MGRALVSRPCALAEIIVNPKHEVEKQRSLDPKSGIQRVEQLSITERFGQTCDRATLDKERLPGLVSLSSDEDDWDTRPAALQFALQIRTGHSRHSDVEDQAFGVRDSI
jgi:hypothetical protein